MGAGRCETILQPSVNKGLEEFVYGYLQSTTAEIT